MNTPAELAREARAKAQSRASQAPAEAPVTPYADATEPVPIPGTSKVALVVRDTRSDALYACSRGITGGRATRLHLDALDALGYVHADDTETLRECASVQAIVAEAVAEATKPAPEPDKPADKPKTTPAKKGTGK